MKYLIIRIFSFIKKRKEIARRKRVAKFMHNQALDSYLYFIKKDRKE